MKRVLCFVLTCIQLLVLTACSNNSAEKTPATISGSNKTMVIYPSLDKEEIQAFAESELSPDGFVMPEDLKLFGSVSGGVTFLPEDYQNDYTYRVYSYVPKDANGEKLWIIISHCGIPGWQTKSILKNFPQTELSVSSGMRNMYSLRTEDTGWIHRNDISYYYVRGKLSYLIFYVGDIEFTISDIPDNPMDGEYTFLQGLLSINDTVASAALNEFRWAIISRDPGAWLIPIGVGVVVVALGVVGLVVWKKKKRKAAAEK